MSAQRCGCPPCQQAFGAQDAYMNVPTKVAVLFVLTGMPVIAFVVALVVTLR